MIHYQLSRLLIEQWEILSLKLRTEPSQYLEMVILRLTHLFSESRHEFLNLKEAGESYTKFLKSTR